ncbi:MAG: acetyl-CoA C-acyltransferase, partial [Nannocystaceae bacterium]
MTQLKQAVLVAARRSAVGRALKGSLKNTNPVDIATDVLAGTLKDLPGLPGSRVDDVVMGCAMPEAEQGLNVARVIGLRAGLPQETSAITINRFCSSGLQAIASCAERVMVGAIDCAIGG